MTLVYLSSDCINKNTGTLPLCYLCVIYYPPKG